MGLEEVSGDLVLLSVSGCGLSPELSSLGPGKLGVMRTGPSLEHPVTI